MKGIYLVADRTACLGRPVEEVILAAVKGGVSIVQLREKDVSTRFFIEEAQRIKELLAPYDVPLIINDRIDIALAVDADGVHIGQEDMPYPVARRLLGRSKIIGLSVETEAQVKEAETFDVDYISVSAVFPTPTKTDVKHVWGLEGLKRVKTLSRHKVVAIGGINSHNAAEVIQAGADSIAVVSAICSAEDPEVAARQLKEIFETTYQTE